MLLRRKVSGPCQIKESAPNAAKAMRLFALEAVRLSLRGGVAFSHVTMRVLDQAEHEQEAWLCYTLPSAAELIASPMNYTLRPRSMAVRDLYVTLLPTAVGRTPPAPAEVLCPGTATRLTTRETSTSDQWQSMLKMRIVMVYK